MEDHYACLYCGHCDGVHGYDFVRCRWTSPYGWEPRVDLVCPCTRDRTSVIEAGIERWPDEDDEP